MAGRWRLPWGGGSHAKCTLWYYPQSSRGLQGQAEPPFSALSRSSACRTHYLIVIGLLNGHSVRHMAIGPAASSLDDLSRRGTFSREQGELGLFDRREDNGCLKLDEAYLDALYWAVLRTATLLRLAAQPGPASCWSKTRWCAVEPACAEFTSAPCKPSFASFECTRRGRPRPVVRCPWAAAAKTRGV